MQKLISSTILSGNQRVRTIFPWFSYICTILLFLLVVFFKVTKDEFYYYVLFWRRTWCSPMRLHGFRSTVSSMLLWSEFPAKELSEILRVFLPLNRLKRSDISLLSLNPSSWMYSESTNILLDIMQINDHGTSLWIPDLISGWSKYNDNIGEDN